MPSIAWRATSSDSIQVKPGSFAAASSAPARLLELGPREARAQRGDRHAGAPQLGVHRLREGVDERLAGRVGGEARQRLEGGGGGDVEHRAGALLDHPRQERAGDLVHGLDVEADHLGLLLEVVVEEVAEVAEAGVVADADDLALARLQLLDRAAARGGAAEVAGLDVGVDVVGLAQLVGELLEALAAAGDERDVVAAVGELAGDLGADAREAPVMRTVEPYEGAGRAMPAFIPQWSSGPTTAGASRSPRATASRSTSTRCCGRGWSPTGSRAPDESTRPSRCRGRCSSACTTRRCSRASATAS